MADIGTTLREARIRARIDISEVEARTKIRAKYLRAIENEEWDLLPGPVYVKSFLRTYGDFLGVDSRGLVDEYKRRYERPADQDMRPIAPLGRERERKRRRSSRFGRVAAVVVVLAVVAVALFVVGSLSGNNNTTTSSTPSTTGASNPASTTTTHTTTTARKHKHRPPPPPKPTTVTLKLVPTSSIYVCVEDGTGKKLIPGLVYAAGQTIPTETASKLMITLGNPSVQMKVNGKTVPVAGVSDRIRADARQDQPARRGSAAHVHMSARRFWRTGVSTGGPRAGILITGTEVLSGIISDRNGPWLSERLVEIGVDAAMIQIVGDRPDDLLASLRFMAEEGMALIVTSGGPRADRRRSHRRGRGRVRRPRDGARRGSRGTDRRDPPAADDALAGPRSRRDP